MNRLIYIAIFVFYSTHLFSQKVKLAINPDTLVLGKYQGIVCLNLTLKNNTDSLICMKELSKEIYSINDYRAKDKYLRYNITDVNGNSPEFNVGLLNSPVTRRKKNQKDLKIPSNKHADLKIRINLSGYILQKEFYRIKLFYFKGNKQFSLSNETVLMLIK